MALRGLILGSLLSFAPAAYAQAAHADAAAPVPARVDIALGADRLATLPREDVQANAHGKVLSCSGVALFALLRQQAAVPAEPLHGAQLARRVEAHARDGYQVTFSLAELDPTLGNRRVLLVDRCEGRALPQDDGPLRLIVPDDARPARWIRQLDRLSLLAP